MKGRGGQPPFLIVRRGKGKELFVSVLFAPVPSEPMLGVIAVIPVTMAVASRPLSELQAMANRAVTKP